MTRSLKVGDAYYEVVESLGFQCGHRAVMVKDPSCTNGERVAVQQGKVWRFWGVEDRIVGTMPEMITNKLTPAMIQSDHRLHEALELWGEEAQLKMALEECGELISAICQNWRGRNSVEAVTSEVADVLIMMLQMRILVGTDDIDKMIYQKMHRLGERIQNFKDDQNDT